MSSLSVRTSMGLQNHGKISGSSKLDNLIALYDQLTLQRNKIEKSTTLTKEEKDKQLVRINNKMNNLNDQITAEKRKADQKTQQKQSEEEKEQIENTTDPETAQMRLEAEELMKMAVNITTTDTTATASSKAASVDELAEATNTTNASSIAAKDKSFTSSQNLEGKVDTITAETEEAAAAQDDYNEKAGAQAKNETADDGYDTIPDHADHTVAQSTVEDTASALQEEKEKNKDNLLFSSLLKKFKKGLFIDKRV